MEEGKEKRKRERTNVSGKTPVLSRSRRAFPAVQSVFLLLGSLIAPIRGRHALGMRLALAGNMMVAGAGFLGGHLALNRGAARRTTRPAPK